MFPQQDAVWNKGDWRQLRCCCSHLAGGDIKGRCLYRRFCGAGVGYVMLPASIQKTDTLFLDISKVSLILLVTVLALLMMMMMMMPMPMQMQLLLLHAVGENVIHSLHTYFPFSSLPFPSLLPGPLSTPRLSATEGLDDFKGTLIHSSQWDPSIDLRGKTVGVVGTGSTGVQLITEVRTSCLVLISASCY